MNHVVLELEALFCERSKKSNQQMLAGRVLKSCHVDRIPFMFMSLLELK